MLKPPFENVVIKGYTAAARDLIPRYESISPDQLTAPIKHLLPTDPARIADIGAGTGVAAAWLALQGHQVLAVEPVAQFRDAGKSLHPSDNIEWLNDTLPALTKTLQRREEFDVILLSAVWHHLEKFQRQIAIPNIRELLAPRGKLIISLRDGPGAHSRPCYDASTDELIALASAQDLQPVFQQTANSIQAANQKAGVTWTWMVFSDG